MNNTVTMSLEEYTAIIKENILLKNKLDGLKRNAKNQLEEQIKDSLISCLTKEETIEWLNKEGSLLIKKFTNDYSWTWESIAQKSYVLTADEVKVLCAELIMNLLNNHLRDILEREATEEAK